MFIHNVRLGFASNSSSTHSIILAGSAKGSSERSYFGWEPFLQKTRTQKAAYLAQTFRSSVEGQMDTAAVNAIIKDLFGESFSDFEDDGYVDHQSLLAIPKKTKKDALAVEFFAEMSRALMEDDSAHIQGGSDNSDYDKGTLHDEWSWWERLHDYKSDHFRCRKDGSTWTLFNRRSGNKITVDFTKKNEPFKAMSPHLIDIKITDYCARGCDFCYQGSTPKGKHAPFERIKSLILGLAQASDDRPFEIALGGGEPTAHPQFADILRLCREQDIVPNFTTNAPSWYRDAGIREAVIDCVGGYARSVTNRCEIEYELKCYDAMRLLTTKDRIPELNFHYILDAFDLETFKEVLKHVSFHPLILLGYKTQGRAAARRPHVNTGWPYLTGDRRIGIDTLLANQYADELKAFGVSDKLYYTEEGKHSLYIDAVAETFGKSSYCGEYKPYTTTQNIINTFKDW